MSNINKIGLLKVSGPDAKKFLQGQITCNMDDLSETHSLLGAHCNPQGRVIFLFRIISLSQAYYLLLPQSMVQLALEALQKYAKFFKVQLSEASTEDSPELQDKAAPECAFFNIEQGIPQIYPSTSGLFLPHDLGMHERDGISWNKGCYTGQEIIARMHYRGKLKNQLYRLKIQTTVSLERGSELKTEIGPALGQVVDFHQQGYNSYIVLVLGPEQMRVKNELWEWLD